MNQTISYHYTNKSLGIPDMTANKWVMSATMEQIHWTLQDSKDSQHDLIEYLFA